MTYSEEVKKEVFKRISKEEEIEQISEDTGISIETLYNWKNSEEYVKFQKTKQASEEIGNLIKQGKFEQAEEICRRDEFKDNEAIQSQLVTILIEKGDKESLAEAEEICRRDEFKDNEAIQSQLVIILIEKGDKESLTEAEEICRRDEFKDNEEIQSQLVTILIEKGDKESLAEAETICRRDEFKKNKVIQSQLVTILVKKGDKKSLEEAIKICEENITGERVSLKDKEIFQRQYQYAQSKKIVILMKKGDEKSLTEVEEICRRDELKSNKVIQSQLVNLLIKKGDEESLVEAEEICKEAIIDKRVSSKQKNVFKTQLEKVQKALEQIKLDKKLFKAIEIEESTESEQRKLLNIIKTKLYYDDITPEFIEQIKLDNTELTEWEKTLALLAIYDKQKSTKTAERILKQGKRAFKEDAEKMKALNKLENTILSKKSRAFNWQIFDNLLSWKLSEKVQQEIKAKKEVEEAKERERQQKLEEIAQSTERRHQRNAERQVRTEYTILQRRPVKANQSNVTPKPKISATEVPKPKTKPKVKEKRIAQIFGAELAKLKGNILWAQSRIDYKDKRLKIPNNVDFKKYKIPEEALEELKEKFSQERLIIKDLDQIDTLSNKPTTDFRAKMQIILLFRKYGMKEIADKKLPFESSIYEDINSIILMKRQLLRKKKDESKMTHIVEDNLSKKTEEALCKIEKIDGNKDFAYQLMEKALDEGK